MDHAALVDSYTRSSPLSSLERDRMDGQFRRNTSLPLNLALSMVDPREQLTVVDFGSGYGPSAGVLAERGITARLHYIDVNAELLEHARRRALAAGLMVDAIVGALDECATYRFCADVAVASFVLTHCRDLKQALVNLSTSVRVGGAVVIADVDYFASAVEGDEAALATLHCLRERLAIKDLAVQIDAAAAESGLRPEGGFACIDWIEVTTNGTVKDDALGFVGNFDASDPAYAAWKRITPNARMYTRRLRRVYRRIQ